MAAVYDALACRGSYGAVKLEVCDMTVSSHSMHAWSHWIKDNPAWLCVEGAELGPKGAALLAALVINQNVMYLNINKNNIGPEGCKALIRAISTVSKGVDGEDVYTLRCPKVKLLIRYNNIGDECFS